MHSMSRRCVWTHQIETVCLGSNQTFRVKLVDKVGIRRLGSFIRREADAHNSVLEVRCAGQAHLQVADGCTSNFEGVGEVVALHRTAIHVRDIKV